jgi:undecaprenyl-diphosphatase
MNNYPLTKETEPATRLGKQSGNMDDKKSTQIRLGLILVSVIITLVIFASLAEDVVNHEELSAHDPILGNWIVSHASPEGDRVFSAIAFWGNALTITAGTVGLNLWLSKRKRWEQIIFLDAAVGGEAMLNLVLKQIFVRPRPAYPHTFLTEVGFSFPSGHAMASVVFYGAIAYLSYAYLKTLRAKVLVTIGAVFIAGIIGYSRLYLGVHFLSDVIAGWVAGGFWLSACILADQLHRGVSAPSPTS